MKRTLIVMRHAKTEDQGMAQKDVERNLTTRGKNDALMMAERLMKKEFKPDTIIASNANRTVQTAQILAAHFGLPLSSITLLPELYMCQAYTIENTILSVSEDIKTCLLIGHNPSVSDFIYDTDSKAITRNIPTAGLAIFSFKDNNWKNFTEQKKKFELLDYPKN
ncbi:MAG: histidine phosphatase family protein [Phycisphaerales bacterium]|nr:histidine phosphatase family protein [Phycisphaerales bacterium]